MCSERECGIIGIEVANRTARKENSVSQRLLERIRDAIAHGDYDLTRHAVDEMAEDDLDILAVECAILDDEIYLIITVYEVTEQEE